jgi:hypothetical protein
MNISLHKIGPAGAKVKYHGVEGTLLNVSGDDSYVFVRLGQHEKLLVAANVIQADVINNKLLFIDQRKLAASDMDYSIEQKIEIDRRRAYVQRIKTLRPLGGCGGVNFIKAVIAQVKRELNDDNPPSRSTLIRWYQKTEGHVAGLYATLRNSKRNRGSYYDEYIRDFALACIDNYYLCLSRPSIQSAYDCFVEEYEEHVGNRDELPCYATFALWIKELPAIDIIHARQGKRTARAAMRNNTSQLFTDHILQRVEADAVNLTLGLIDDEGNYLGPATIFALIDCHSRAILGYKLQIGRGESASSVIESYAHALLEKDPAIKCPEVKNNWPMHGVFETLVSDGGSGYTALTTQHFLMSAGIDPQLAQTGCGWKKPFIERFFFTLRIQLACTLPGYCGKFKDQRELDATMREQACMTPDELENVLTQWIVDEYHQAPHKGLGNHTPYNVWQSQAMLHVMLPANADDIKRAKGDFTYRKINGDASQSGVVNNHLSYNDPNGRLKEIGMQMRQRGEEASVKVSYSNNDISTVNVLDEETGELIELHCTDPRVSFGMSRAEFDAAFPKINSYKDKGFGHSRATRNNKAVQSARELHLNKMKAACKKKPATTKIEELTELLNCSSTIKLAEKHVPDEHSSTQTGDDIDFNDMEAHADA